MHSWISLLPAPPGPGANPCSPDDARRLALAMLQYTPEAVFGPDGSLLLNVGASLRAFGGPARLCRLVRASLRRLGLEARLGMAPTAHGAWLLAARPQPGPRRVLRLANLARRLDALPCALLPAARPHQAWLDGVGCRTLASLARLPRAGVRKRCGAELPQQLDQAYGKAPERFAWIQAPPDFSARVELLARIDHAPAVLAIARELARQLEHWLQARHAAVPGFALLLEHERGRRARPPTRLAIALARPAWEAGHMLRLLKEHLGRLALEAPVIAIALQASDIAARSVPSAELFIDPGGPPGSHERLLELLVARLGEDCVRAPRPHADHRPEAANRWLPVTRRGPRPPDDTPANPVERPLWLLPAPIALAMRGPRPCHGTPLRLLRGPERIENGWWDGQPVSRDYFVAESEDFVRYWIYREVSSDAPRWYLHGLFG